MKWLYYTFILLILLLAAAAIYVYLRPVSLPGSVSDTSGAGWHIVDPRGALRSFLPLPGPARRLIRSIHVAGDGTRPVLLEIQSGLPGWVLRRISIPGWKQCISSDWDLCLAREDVSGKIPSATRGDGMSGWLKTAPPVTFTVQGDNPFQFKSFCQAPAEEAEGRGGDLRLDLEAFAGSSPHLQLALPGMDLKRARLGRDYGDVLFQYNNKLRDVTYGRLEGEEDGREVEASLYVRYRRSDVLQGRMIPHVIKINPILKILDTLEVECHPQKGGESCTGRVSLTF
jgi:hypothetical protein